MIDFAAYELDPKFVRDALRLGEVDYIEPVTEAAETDLFRHLISPPERSTRGNAL